jgi:hypothetical protein
MPEQCTWIVLEAFHICLHEFLLTSWNSQLRRHHRKASESLKVPERLKLVQQDKPAKNCTFLILLNFKKKAEKINLWLNY